MKVYAASERNAKIANARMLLSNIFRLGQFQTGRRCKKLSKDGRGGDSSLRVDCTTAAVAASYGSLGNVAMHVIVLNGYLLDTLNKRGLI